MFGVGAIFGPILAALLMTEVGHIGIFLFTGGVHLGLAAFVVLRIWQHGPVHPSKKAAAFLAVPETTHAILPLDPRFEDVNEAKRMIKHPRAKAVALYPWPHCDDFHGIAGASHSRTAA